MKTLLSIVLASCLAFALPAFATPQRFQSEQAAQQHCPNDTVVWVNTQTGVYHFKGQRWYAATKYGAFECRTEANTEGDRATHNGQ